MSRSYLKWRGRTKRDSTSWWKSTGGLDPKCPKDCPYIIGIIRTKKDRCGCYTDPTDRWKVKNCCYLYDTKDHDV
jgi:hypothetical protein